MSDDTLRRLAEVGHAFRDHGLTAAINMRIFGFVALIAAITRRAPINQGLLQRFEREHSSPTTPSRAKRCGPAQSRKLEPSF